MVALLPGRCLGWAEEESSRIRFAELTGFAGLAWADEGSPWGLRPLSQLTAASPRWISLRSCANGPYGDHFVRYMEY